MENNKFNKIKLINKSLLFNLNIDELIEIFSDDETFLQVLFKFKNLSSDIFCCHNFFKNLPENCYLFQTFKFMTENLKNSSLNLKLFLVEIKKLSTSENFTIEEVFVSLILILYFFLKESVSGPSFFHIKETEKVDHHKDLDKFYKHTFFQIQENIDQNNIKNEILEYLECNGERPYSNIKLLIFFVIVYELFLNTTIFEENFNVINLWKARILFLHNKILKEPVEEIQKKIFQLLDDDSYFNMIVNLDNLDPNSFNLIKGMLSLEKNYYQLKYYKYKSSEDSIEEARKLFNLKISLSGRLGKKTKFQDFDSAILVVESQSSTLNDKNEIPNITPNTIKLDDENPLLESPFIISDNISQQNLSIYDQMYVTALINHYKISLPDEDLLREVISTYTSKSLEKSYDWLVYSKLLLQKALAEDKRSKTIERSLMQLQSLCDQYNDRNLESFPRLRNYFVVDYPFVWEMKKLYAQVFMKYGAVNTAFDIFNELMMYEEAIQCLYIAGKNDRALQYANEVLRIKEDPGVYCVLGEINNNEEYYFKALTVSKNKYIRAYRCLGKFYFVKNDLDKSIIHYEKALEVNPLFPNIWFTLGCIYLKLNNWEKASTALSKCVSIDDTNAEGWANLASSFIQLNKLPEAMKCLDEGFKLSRTNWRMCENMMYVAIDLKDFNKLVFCINTLFTLDQFERVKPNVFYNLISIFLTQYHKFSDKNKEIYKKRIYQIFDMFSMKDGVTPDIWDLYCLFVEGVELKLDDSREEKLDETKKQIYYKKLIEIRLKQARTLMIAEIWEKDEKMIEKVKKVADKLADELKRVTDQEFVLQISSFIDNVKVRIEKFYKIKMFEKSD